ncbi:hypothetical protein KSF_103070 [Reticulibacter mediterranei]|uniref:Uncharacterized protein n=1 Tax=Reticulibacter mediterranei TaxID=2778369 RepID=A0A8J3IQT2_9CHLR|nr:hypothetical protein KSF_103070 [Reticulibacter mediterranei]
MAWYPQLYSRVGFVHQYRTLDREEQQELIEQQVRSFGGRRGNERKIEKEALVQIIRMTGEFSANGTRVLANGTHS